jgi:hypothetical protein
MKRWQVFAVLAALVLVLALALELMPDGQGVESAKVLRISTPTATTTPTPGWWEQVATWTPIVTATTATPTTTTTPQQGGQP